MTKYQVAVDRNACIACGVAVDQCPQVFVLAEDNGKNRVLESYSEKTSADTSVGVVPEDLYGCVERAVEACPVQAITAKKISD